MGAIYIYTKHHGESQSMRVSLTNEIDNVLN